MDDFLDDMFDLDNDGELDDMEEAEEVSFITEDFDDEDYDNEEYYDEEDED